jgi:signal transduction histidine kinase
VKFIRALFGSMTGHMFFLLFGGMAAAALIASITSDLNNRRELARQAQERAVDRLQSFVIFLDNAPSELRQDMLDRSGSGVLNQQQPTPGIEPDAAFSSMLAQRGGLLATAVADKAPQEACFAAMGGPRGPPFGMRGSRTDRDRGERADRGDDARGGRRDIGGGGREMLFEPDGCRLVSLKLTDGTPLRLGVETPRIRVERSRWLDPAFVILFGAGTVLLAWLAAVRASAPLRRLAQASTQLGQDLHRQPLAVTGSTEVRQAIGAFNSMQARLQGHFAERTQMLAAITHDLQTPLTRLRLRLERVDDQELRERLVADLAAMRALIDEGLELARTAETPETVMLLDLDSVLESQVEDANEAGLAATFAGGCGAVLPLRPLATRRVFANLIDNALLHGGSVDVRAVSDKDSVCVFVRDHGPGIPEELLERAFDPFFRTDNSRSRETGGTGLGLTIARMLAAKIGATLTLRNHPEGGLEAQVKWLIAELAPPPAPRGN